MNVWAGWASKGGHYSDEYMICTTFITKAFRPSNFIIPREQKHSKNTLIDVCTQEMLRE